MKYVVLTAKHHEGFCLFDSQFTDYRSTNTPCHKDLVKEYVEAFRAEGLKVGSAPLRLRSRHLRMSSVSLADYPELDETRSEKLGLPVLLDDTGRIDQVPDRSLVIPQHRSPGGVRGTQYQIHRRNSGHATRF